METGFFEVGGDLSFRIYTLKRCKNMGKNKELPELLAPANNLNILKYAVRYGADAVYIGGKDFNLRSIRGNFTIAEIKEGVKYAHANNTRVYLTLNSVIHDSQLEPLSDYLQKIKEISLDGIIVSDTGAFKMVKDIIPSARIHISTQANITNHLGVKFFEEMGAVRVNLAREVTFPDLKKIIESSNIEIEIFIHGALCISYSGRCMLSKYMSGRDANMGQCAHSCRWNYYLMEEGRPNSFFPVDQDKNGTYIYNSRDLCILPELKSLVDAGVSGLKIEGRMKTENYVSLVTRVYRRALDLIKQERFSREKISSLEAELDKCSHRNFTRGFMFLENRKELEDNDNVGYIKKYRFVGVYKGFSKQYNGPVITVKNQFREGESLDISQPGEDPKIFKLEKIRLASGDKELETANPNDEVIICDLGKVSVYSIFRIEINK